MLEIDTICTYYSGMVNWERIIQDCYWERDLSKEELEAIVSGTDGQAKKRLFERILLNSSMLLSDLRVFPSEELAALLEDYSPPQFNHEYAFRRKNIAEVFFLDKELKVKELQWRS